MLIFHGDNQVASRQDFLKVKDAALKSGKQIINLSGGKLTLSELASSVETVSLLGSVNAVFVDDFFSRRQSNEKKEIVSYLQSSLGDIFLWESKDQSAQLKSFSPTVIKKFDLPKYIFQFLDTLSLSTLHLALSTISPEQILALLAGHIHKLILAKEEVGDFPSWQLAKLRSQSSKFSLDQLSTFNFQLLTIDYKLKTSALPYDLSTALELWTLKLTRL